MSKQNTLRNAVAIVEMEGYKITKQDLTLIQRYLDGDINIKEMIDLIKKRGDKHE